MTIANLSNGQVSHDQSTPFYSNKKIHADFLLYEAFADTLVRKGKNVAKQRARA